MRNNYIQLKRLSDLGAERYVYTRSQVCSEW